MTGPACILDWAGNHLGIPYDASGRRDLTPWDGTGPTDCSGFTASAIRACGIEPRGFNSTGQELWCRANDRGITASAAVRIAGSLLFVWGYGPKGHVAISRGDGTTYETPAWGRWGHASGIGSAYDRGWTGGGLIPGVDYAGTPAGGGQVVTLRRGSTGQPVKDLQTWLNQLGHQAGAVDGDFGPQTEAALRRFQQQAGIEVDGIAGPQTLGTIHGALIARSSSGEPATARQQYLVGVGRFIAGLRQTVLRRGSRGANVVGLQQILNQNGARIAADGVFGPATEAAVRAYQKSRKLVVDGIAGPQTWAKLLPS